jgi:hypothetical protein
VNTVNTGQRAERHLWSPRAACRSKNKPVDHSGVIDEVPFERNSFRTPAFNSERPSAESKLRTVLPLAILEDLQIPIHLFPFEMRHAILLDSMERMFSTVIHFPSKLLQPFPFARPTTEE